MGVVGGSKIGLALGEGPSRAAGVPASLSTLPCAVSTPRAIRSVHARFVHGCLARAMLLTATWSLRLPPARDPVGMPLCLLRHLADVAGLPTAAVGSGTAHGLPIANSPTLLAQTICLQANAHAPGYSAAQTSVSNRIDWGIGDV